MPTRTNRREFLGSTAAAGIGYWVVGRTARAESRSPNEKLNIACVGVGGRGKDNTGGMANENIVALCDVDEVQGAESFKRFTKAEKCKDYRRLFDKLHKQIDAVVVSTPDHMHAPITLAALELGKHVYCEKPLTRTVGEARRVAEVTARKKLVTQMGNWGNCKSEARRTVELIRASVIGPVREIHAWTDRPSWICKQGMDRPTDTPPVPPTLAWDLWLGVAPQRPYHPAYLPGKWRGWYDFGTGALGDMACHICNVFFWGLNLRDPVAVECEVSDRHQETFPAWSRIAWEYPAREDRPALKMYWYDGGQLPAAELFDGHKVEGNGSLLIGEKGKIYIPSSEGTTSILLPEAKFADYKRPPRTLPDSPGHHDEWVNNIKSGELGLDYMSHFGRAAVMTEALLLGSLAIRTGRRIEWDARQMKVTNIDEANEFVNPLYRKGWES